MRENIDTSRKKFIIIVSIMFAVYLIIEFAFWTVFPFILAFTIAFIIRKIVVTVIKLTGLKIKEASFVLLLICYILFFGILYILLN